MWIVIIDNILRQPQYLTMFFKNSLVISSIVQLVGAAMKVVYLENLFTTNMIESLSSDLGSPMMKSMVTLSHGRSAIGNGSNRPLGCH